MEGLEDGVTRPRQVRYQAALRPDCTHSTPLPDRLAPCFGPTVSKLLQSWGGCIKTRGMLLGFVELDLPAYLEFALPSSMMVAVPVTRRKGRSKSTSDLWSITTVSKDFEIFNSLKATTNRCISCLWVPNTGLRRGRKHEEVCAVGDCGRAAARDSPGTAAPWGSAAGVGTERQYLACHRRLRGPHQRVQEIVADGAGPQFAQQHQA